MNDSNVCYTGWKPETTRTAEKCHEGKQKKKKTKRKKTKKKTKRKKKRTQALHCRRRRWHPDDADADAHATPRWTGSPLPPPFPSLRFVPSASVPVLPAGCGAFYSLKGFLSFCLLPVLFWNRRVVTIRRAVAGQPRPSWVSPRSSFPQEEGVGWSVVSHSDTRFSVLLAFHSSRCFHSPSHAVDAVDWRTQTTLSITGP